MKARELPTAPQANFRLVDEIKVLRPADVQDLNKDDVYDAFKALRWGWEGGRPHCRCGSESIYEYSRRRIFKCARCGRQFSVTSGTTFHARKLSHQGILTALATTLHDPVNPHRLCLDMGINYRTAVRLMKAFRLFVGNIDVRGRDKCWPYLTADPQTEVEKIMLRVADSIPRNVPEQVRADVGQELVLGLLAGDFGEDQLHRQLSRYIRAHYKAVEHNQFRDVSLDQPCGGTDGMSWYEVLHGDEGRVDHQSAWMLRQVFPDQIEETFRGEVAELARQHGCSISEALEFLNGNIEDTP